jgi:hypothetical protein
MVRYTWLAVLVLVGLTVPAQAQVKLEWKFKKGDKFWLETGTKLNQTIQVAGQEIKQSMDNTTVNSYTIKDVTNDGVILEQKIESVKMSSTGRLSGADELAKKMKGTTFTLTLDKDGKITKFEGYDEFINRLANDDPKVAKGIKQMLSQDTLTKATQEAFGFLPSDPVKKGSTWKKSVTVPLGPLGNFKADNTYTLEGEVKEGQKIDVKAEISYSTPDENQDTGLGFKVTKGELKSEEGTGGTMIFDAKTGRLVKSDIKVKIKGSMTIEVSGNSATMDLEQEQTSTVRLLDKAPAD